MARGRLHTTTVRFDADTWATIVAESDRLGIAHAEYIRGAVLRRVGRGDVEQRLSAIERRLEELAGRLATIGRIMLRRVQPRAALRS